MLLEKPVEKLVEKRLLLNEMYSVIPLQNLDSDIGISCSFSTSCYFPSSNG